MNCPTSSKQHTVTFPFSFLAGADGGLPRAIESALDTSHAQVTILSTDSLPVSRERLTIKPAETGALANAEIFRLWFGSGDWCELHPAAHTELAQPSDALAAMFKLGLASSSQQGPGSLSYLQEYIREHAPGRSIAHAFNGKYDNRIAEIPANSVVNWQDYFFAPSIEKHANGLRAKNVFQTWHLHTTIPDSLSGSQFGNELLRAAALVDVVLVHTQQYANNLGRQLEAMRSNGSINRLPEIRIFTLGIDTQAADLSARLITPDNYRDRLALQSLGLEANYDALSRRQQAFVDEVFRAQAQDLPHRFMSIDRMDPGKGSATVAKATERFLDEATERYGAQYVKENVRFFFLHSQWVDGNADVRNIKECYGEFVRGLYENIQRKYPDSVWIAEGISGVNKPFIYAIMKGCTGITGGAQDGLNLACMENAWVNREHPTGIIVGSGAGVAIDARYKGINPKSMFPTAGSVEEFVDSMFHLTPTLAGTSTVQLREHKLPLVDFIERRSTNLLVTE